MFRCDECRVADGLHRMIGWQGNLRGLLFVQGCLLAGCVALCWPMGARPFGSDTLFQHGCLIAARFLQSKVWLLWGIPGMGTRAAERLVHQVCSAGLNGVIPTRWLPPDPRMRWLYCSTCIMSLHCCGMMHWGVITSVAVARPNCWTPRSFFTASLLALAVSAQKMSSAFARPSLPANTQSRTG